MVIKNGKNIKISDMIKELCNKNNIRVLELARRIGQALQNFDKKLKQDIITLDELKHIADVMKINFVSNTSSWLDRVNMELQVIEYRLTESIEIIKKLTLESQGYKTDYIFVVTIGTIGIVI